MIWLLFLLLLAIWSGGAIRYDFERDLGGIRDIVREDVAWLNGRLLNHSLNNVLGEGDAIIFGSGSYYVMGGIIVEERVNISLHIQGKILFSSDTSLWPRDIRGDVLDALIFRNCRGIVFTGSFQYGEHVTELSDPDFMEESVLSVYDGVIDGNGAHWWHFPYVGYILHVEDRPRILRMIDCTDTLVENLLLINSPYWTTLFENVTRLEVRYVEIINRRTISNDHTVSDMSALNTDGIDVTGRYVYVHDVTIWTQDDCIAVKDGSQHMLFENINASGMGLAIGSIGSSHNRNITFRNAYLYSTVKAIYMKFRRKDDESREFRCPCNYEREEFGLIEDVLFENIIIDHPEQFAIWIGPAQQVDKVDPSSCSLAWPLLPWASCKGQVNGKFKNLVLRNISIIRPTGIGLLLGTSENPIENVVFDNVKVDYSCDNLEYRSLADVFSKSVDLVKASDEYVFPAYISLSLGLILTVMCCRQDLKYIFAILPLVVGYCGVLHSMLKMLEPDEYELCEHVINGTSYNSWPVPACFVKGSSAIAGPNLGCLKEIDYYHSFLGIKWLRLIPTYILLSLLPFLGIF